MRKLTTAAFALLFSACGTADQNDDFTGLDGVDQKSDAFSSKLKMVGSIDYNQSVDVSYTANPKYRALTFTGRQGDHVIFTVDSQDGVPMAWVLDSSFKTVAKDTYGQGAAHLDVKLPAAPSDTHYLVVRDAHGGKANFSVLMDGAPAHDFYSCHRDADCVAVPEVGCCHTGRMAAVNAHQKDGYENSFVCNEQRVCPLYVILDTRQAECSNDTHQCEMVAVDHIACGGFVGNPHGCPKSYSCAANHIPDVPGKCVADQKNDSCGGCAAGQFCSFCWGKYACIPNGAQC